MTDVFAAIADLDTRIEALTDERDTLVDRLERHAQVWHERYPERSGQHWRRRCCAAGFFVFVGVEGDRVVFGTDCSYDGKAAGAGVEVPRAWMDRALADEDAADPKMSV